MGPIQLKVIPDDVNIQ